MSRKELTRLELMPPLRVRSHAAAREKARIVALVRRGWMIEAEIWRQERADRHRPLYEYVQLHGVPAAGYSDRPSIFRKTQSLDGRPDHRR